MSASMAAFVHADLLLHGPLVARAQHAPATVLVRCGGRTASRRPLVDQHDRTAHPCHEPDDLPSIVTLTGARHLQ